MPSITILFGLLLAALGLAGYLGTGSAHPTALIPCGFGLLLAGCGVLARPENPRRRGLWMHIAVTLATLGFLGTVPAMVDLLRHLRGVVLAHPAAVEEKAAMGALCLVFVLLCVRSFIAARRGRAEAGATPGR